MALTRAFGDAVENRETLSTAFFSATGPSIAPQDQTPQQTLFEALGTDIPKVEAANLDSKQVSTDQLAANKTAGINQADVKQIANQAQEAKAVMSKAVRDVQGVIAEAAQEAKIDMAQAYPDIRHGNTNMAVDLAAGAAGGAALKGAGTIAGTALTNTGAMQDLAAGLKGQKMSSAQIRATVEDHIRTKAAEATSPTAMALNSDAPKPSAEPTPEQQLVAAMDAGFDTKCIMDLDPDNLHQLPEWQEVCEIEDQALEVAVDLQVTMDDTEYKAGLSLDQEEALAPALDELAGQGVSMDSLTNIEFDAGDAALAGDAISGITSIKLTEEFAAVASHNALDTVKQALEKTPEPVVEVPPPQNAQTAFNTMGGMFG